MSQKHGEIPHEGECDGCGKFLSRPLPRERVGNVSQPIRVKCLACNEVTNISAGTSDTDE